MVEKLELGLEFETTLPELREQILVIVLGLNLFQDLDVVSTIRTINILVRKRVVDVQPGVENVSLLGFLGCPVDDLADGRLHCRVVRFVDPDAVQVEHCKT